MCPIGAAGRAGTLGWVPNLSRFVSLQKQIPSAPPPLQPAPWGMFNLLCCWGRGEEGVLTFKVPMEEKEKCPKRDTEETQRLVEGIESLFPKPYGPSMLGAASAFTLSRLPLSLDPLSGPPPLPAASHTEHRAGRIRPSLFSSTQQSSSGAELKWGLLLTPTPASCRPETHPRAISSPLPPKHKPPSIPPSAPPVPHLQFAELLTSVNACSFYLACAGSPYSSQNMVIFPLGVPPTMSLN